ncbi:MAG: CHAT domain-containing protein, partial [Saprospiraceae bacterium]|nr:CHAT domain-containing protein [Saprospiraceae bacterium]
RDYLEAGQTAGLADIRAALHDSAVLLSWFDAGDRYLCLALRRNGLFGFETPRDSALEQAVLNFQTALSDKAAQERDPAVFFAAAWFLKQRLLPDSILRGTNALAIAPDGALAYLPVEVLLTQPHRGPYSTAPYLLRSHRVQYLWSAALLAAPKGARESRSEWLQVAPFVPAGRRGLAPLPNSLRELPEDGPSEVWQGEQAVAGAFLEQAANYGLLHLSTHAHAGGGAEPGIEMYDRAVGLSEIYGQRLQAQLVALSACETGTGAFAGGEGVLSLARAFAYAGAQSLVASYWSVPDRSTADLFTEFYRQLGAGQTRSEALRQAKLALLRQAGPDARKAPFYWAAFTLSGADGPVELPVGRAYFWWVLALGLAAGLLGWWWWWWRQTFQAEKLG